MPAARTAPVSTAPRDLFVPVNDVRLHVVDWGDSGPLVSSLRIESEDIDGLTSEDFDMLDGVYYSRRARTFLAGLRKGMRK